MMIALAAVAALLGLIVGSFLNVVILRRGVGGLGGRSGCTKCGHSLAWYDLVPVLSWLSLFGKCRYCGSRISIQYPLVELASAAAFALLVAAPFPAGPLYRVSFCVIAALLICILVYDQRHTIIPDGWVYLFDVLAFLTMPMLYASLALPGQFVWPFFAAGIFAALPLFTLWAVSSGRWMGFGDVKLALGMGWLLGPVPGVFAVFLGFILGTIVLVPLMLLGGFVTHSSRYARFVPRLTMKSEVPFGPFLIASTFIVWISLLYGIDLPAMIGW